MTQSPCGKYILKVEVDLIPREDVRPELMKRIYAEAVPV